MPLEQEKKQKIVDLVYEHRYIDALNSLTAKERVHAIRLHTQKKAKGVLEKKELDSDAIIIRIIDSLRDGDEDNALGLIAKMAEHERAASPTSNQKKEVPKPPYQNSFTPDTSTISPSGFPPHCEQLAKTVFEGTNPHFVAWLDEFQKKYQIPSTTSTRVFAKKSVEGQMKSAKEKLRRGERNLTPAESDAYYHFNQSINDTLERFKTLNETRGFAHLIEYVFVELLAAFKEDIKINHVFKSSPEEDIFRGSDLVVQTEDGYWFSIDITTSTSSEIHSKKNFRNLQNPSVDLPNTVTFLKENRIIQKNKQIEISRIIQPVDRNIMRQFTYNYLLTISHGKDPNIVDEFQNTLKTMGKDDRENPGIALGLRIR